MWFVLTVLAVLSPGPGPRRNAQQLWHFSGVDGRLSIPVQTGTNLPSVRKVVLPLTLAPLPLQLVVWRPKV